jgi:hypothetical protein
MTRVLLGQIATARSGDKGAASNVGVIAPDLSTYNLLRDVLTTERVADHFSRICRGGVDRYELPNVYVLNFILHDSLGGGGAASLRTDAQGKTHGLGMLYLSLDVPDHIAIPDPAFDTHAGFR